MPWWGQLGLGGIGLGLVFLLLRQTLPEIVTEFRKEAAEMRATFAAERKADRDEHTKRLDSLANTFSTEMKAERDSRESLLGRLFGKDAT